MRPAEVMIVYISIGAAFGTHRYFNSEGSNASRVVFSLAALIAWPKYPAAKFLKSLISLRSVYFAGRAQTDSTFDSLVGTKQLEFDDLLRDCFSGSVLYEYRDILARYSGISLTISNFDQIFKYEILFVGSRQVSDVQHTCLRRRNHLKLIRHRNAVRREFIDLLFKLVNLTKDPDLVGAKAIGFVEAIDDREALDEVMSLINVGRQESRSIPVQNIENQSWLPQQR